MKVLIIANNDVGLYKFRRELVEELLKDNKVHICLPNGEYIEKLTEMGCVYHNYEFSRHGTNPLAELKHISFYKKLLKRVNPDIVFTYTVKPNIYGGMACAKMGISYIANITGLGIAIENGGLIQKMVLALYKIGLRKAQKVFFQNVENQQFMLDKGIVKGKYEMIPGSGVNLYEHKAEPYPEKREPVVLVNIGRIMRDKGADEILHAAKIVHQEYSNVVFRIIGGFDDAYEEKIQSAVSAGEIEYLGNQSDIHSCLRDAHAIVHASYHEGMSNVLLEAAACARPIIATDVAGCRETYENGVSGIACRAQDCDDLVRAIKEFIEMSYREKELMGQAARKKVENEFDRRIVIDRYMNEISTIKQRG